MAIEFTTEAIEDSSAYLTFTWYAYDGNPILAANITTATMSLIDRLTEATINSRTDVDVSAYFHATSGAFAFVLIAADNPIVGTPDVGHEWHVATFNLAATQGGLGITRKVEFHIKVRDEKYIT